MISVDGVEGTIEELGYASITVRSEDGHLYRILTAPSSKT